MSGTVEGGKQAAKTNKRRYGEDFYKINGQKGGRNGTTGGFFANPDLAREAGSKGGKISSRGIPRILCVGDKKFEFDTVKEATQFASKKFGIVSYKFVDGDKVLNLQNGLTATIIRNQAKMY